MTDTSDAALDALVLMFRRNRTKDCDTAAEAITALRAQLATAYARGVHDAAKVIDTAGDGAVTEALSTQLCCNGHHCGCQGADVGAYLQHIIRALAAAPPAHDTIPCDNEGDA